MMGISAQTLTRMLALSAILLGLMTTPPAYAQDPEGNGVIWETRMKVGQQGDLAGFRTGTGPIGTGPIGTMEETAFEWQGKALEVRTLTWDRSQPGKNRITLEISGSLAESHTLGLRINLQSLRLDQAATSGDNRRFSWPDLEEHPGWMPGDTLGATLLNLRIETGTNDHKPDIPPAGKSTREPTGRADLQTQASKDQESPEPGHPETQVSRHRESSEPMHPESKYPETQEPGHPGTQQTPATGPGPGHRQNSRGRASDIPRRTRLDLPGAPKPGDEPGGPDGKIRAGNSAAGKDLAGQGPDQDTHTGNAHRRRHGGPAPTTSSRSCSERRWPSRRWSC